MFTPGEMLGDLPVPAQADSETHLDTMSCTGMDFPTLQRHNKVTSCCRISAIQLGIPVNKCNVVFLEKPAFY